MEAEHTIPLVDLSQPTSSLSQRTEPISFYVKKIMKMAVQSVLSLACSMLQSIVATYYIGHLGNVKLLDGVTFGTSWLNVFGFSVTSGIASGVDTLISQGFGKKDYYYCGAILNKASVILFFACFPCIVLMLSSGTILRLIGVDGEVAMYSFYVSAGLIPVLFANVPRVLLEKFLLAQCITQPQLIFQVVNLVLCPLFCQLFIIKLNLSYLGVCCARFVAEIIAVAGLALYMKYTGCCDKTLVAPTREQLFSEWKEYLSIAIPATLMTCLEWWGFEAMGLVCGKLGVTEIASNIIGINYAAFVFLTCTGIGLATCSLVGNSIGEGNEINAKTYIVIGTTLSTIVVLIQDAILLYWRDFFASFFTTDAAVVSQVKVIIYFIAVMEIFDGIQGTLCKSLVAMGQQAKASFMNLISYYLIMIPIAIVLAFPVGLGVYGVWTAFNVSVITVGLGYFYILKTTDWKQLILDAKNRGTIK